MNRHNPESGTAPDLVPAQLSVRLPSLTANYRELQRRAPGATVIPVVKANAYSLGLGAVARALSEAGADMFFIARVEEGIALRLILPRVRIFVLDGVAAGTAPALYAHHLTPVLNSMDDIADWSALAAAHKTALEAALHVDTGMNRSGLPREDISGVSRERLRGIDLKLILSHLACADEPEHPLNRAQLERFRAALAALPLAPASLAASAGIELGRDYYFDMVRPGIALYGGNPIPKRANPFAAVVTLSGRVLQIRDIAKGETAGYGATFTATRPSRIATVALGYADALMRSLSNKGSAVLHGVRVPFAGRISMDLVALDVTDVPDARRGDEVEFIGDTISISDVAAAAGTIPHEVLTSIGARARRHYLGE